MRNYDDEIRDQLKDLTGQEPEKELSQSEIIARQMLAEGVEPSTEAGKAALQQLKQEQELAEMKRIAAETLAAEEKAKAEQPAQTKDINELAAAQISEIKKAKPPVFHKGIDYATDTAASNQEFTAIIQKGERIFDTNTNLKYWDSLDAIHKGKVSPEYAKAVLVDIPNVRGYADIDLPKLNSQDLRVIQQFISQEIDYKKLASAMDFDYDKIEEIIKDQTKNLMNQYREENSNTRIANYKQLSKQITQDVSDELQKNNRRK